MIIEYNRCYDEQIKDLLVELQEHIVSIDREDYNIITPEYREKYFEKTIEEINNYEGKMFLYVENNNVLGLVAGVINNEEENTYDFKCPKRGRVTELVVTKNIRGKGIGSKLLSFMTEYFKKNNCESILIGVFAYNEKAMKFYEKNGYHIRMTDMISKI